MSQNVPPRPGTSLHHLVMVQNSCYLYHLVMMWNPYCLHHLVIVWKPWCLHHRVMVWNYFCLHCLAMAWNPISVVYLVTNQLHPVTCLKLKNFPFLESISHSSHFYIPTYSFGWLLVFLSLAYTAHHPASSVLSLWLVRSRSLFRSVIMPWLYFSQSLIVGLSPCRY